MTKPARIPTKSAFDIVAALRELLVEHGITMVCYIDRVKIYFDSRSSIASLLPFVVNQSGYNMIVPQRLQGHGHMDRYMDLLQPDIDNLRDLNDKVTGDYVINYLELAMDFYAEDEGILPRWRRALEQMVVLERNKRNKHERYYFGSHEGTHYHASSTSNIGQVIYSDRPKGQPTSPVHLELRLSGLSTVRNEGFTLINDLVDYLANPSEFWNNHSDLRMPIWEVLGGLLDNDAQSRQGRIYSAKRFMQGNGSLQQVLAANPDYREAFKPVPSEKVLRDLVKQYLAFKR